MPTIEPADAPRLVRISDPEHEPLYFDPSAVAALVGLGDGAFLMHLAGGGKIELPPPIAAGVLKQLGLAPPRAKRPPKPAADRPPRVRPPRVEQSARTRPAGLAKKITSFFSV